MTSDKDRKDMMKMAACFMAYWHPGCDKNKPVEECLVEFARAFCLFADTLGFDRSKILTAVDAKGPNHPHDCSDCVHLGSIGVNDFYFHSGWPVEEDLFVCRHSPAQCGLVPVMSVVSRTTPRAEGYSRFKIGEYGDWDIFFYAESNTVKCISLTKEASTQWGLSRDSTIPVMDRSLYIAATCFALHYSKSLNRG